MTQRRSNIIKETVTKAFLFLGVSLLATGCPNPVSPDPEPLSSTIVFADGTAVTKIMGSGTYTNPVSGEGDGAVSYTSDTPATATVDEGTGEVTLVSPGTATITASKAATATHGAVSASYTLTIAPMPTMILVPAGSFRRDGISTRISVITQAFQMSAHEITRDQYLAVMGLDPTWFTVLINGKDIERKKPFPDIYIKAAQDMGLENGECIVFEDATNGVQAAKAANSLCGGITTSFSEEQLRAKGADFIINGLDDFEDFSTIAEFNRLLLRFKAREIASQVRLNAYSPYSQFQVGAAVVSASTGTVYRGCNVENSSYGATICAERGAMMKAVAAEGDFRIDMVVVVSDDDPPAPPCALCLQVMAEFAQADTEVYLYDTKGTCERYRFDELLPHPFIFPTQRHRHQ